MKGCSGFTLVETIVVVAVIGLLAAIAVPSFSAVRAKSLNTSRKANVRQLNNAVEMWAMDTYQSTIGAGVTNYLKGGMDALKVGNSTVNITNITQKSVDYIFSVSDLY